MSMHAINNNHFYPSAIKAVGYSGHQRQAGGQTGGRVSQAISGHFPGWPLKKLVSTITYETAGWI